MQKKAGKCLRAICFFCFSLLIQQMPSTGIYLSDEINAAVVAAATSKSMKVSPWVAEAVEQRLIREGMMPGDPQAEVMAAVAIVGVEKALTVLRKAARTVPAKSAAPVKEAA